MTLGTKIAYFRKNQNITQDALAQQLGVTNQAVSKWESDQCCPDVMLLPKIADIFGISIDELFSREFQPKKEKSSFDFEKIFGTSLKDLDAQANQQKQASPAPYLPDDNVLRVYMYVGQRIVGGGPATEGYTFHYHDSVDRVISCASISCGDVMGNVEVTGNVNCGSVGGDVDAGCSVNCGNVGGDVDAGTDVRCGDVGGDVDAGCTVECGDVGGDIDACGPVTIRK